MLDRILSYMPSRQFWLANIVFWILVNSFKSWHRYYQRIYYAKPMEWADIWMNYIPWWGTWILFTPIVFAAVKLIPLERKSLFSFIPKHLLYMVATLVAYWSVSLFMAKFMSKGGVTFSEYSEAYSSAVLFGNVQTDILTYLAILFTRYFYVYYHKSKQQTLHNEQLEKQLLQVELQSLKSQLNPHFLFNTLNSVTGLIRLNKNSNAITALSELGLMLRRVLENQDNQMTTLSKEMEFINSYLIIQKMRFEDKLDTQVDVDEDCLFLELPFMLLQPLVENAVQHGSQLESNKNVLTLKVYSDHDQLVVKLVNKMPEKSEHQGFGIGLKNCRQRMEMLYGNNFKLELTELDDGYFETYLSLPVGEYID